MQTLSAVALLLDVVDLAERDRIVTFVTPEYGKRRGVARGARTKYSRFAGQLQTLSKVHLSWFEKEGRDLVRISDVELVRPATPLMEDLEGILLGTYLAEHLQEFIQEEEDAEKFFRLLDSTLEALLNGVDRNLAMRYFEVWVLRLSGIFPIPRECPLCGSSLVAGAVLVEPEGALVCGTCGEGAAGLVVGRGEIEFLLRSGKENLLRLAEGRPDVRLLRRIEEICGRVRRSFLQAELRSYQVMRETLGGLPS